MELLTFASTLAQNSVDYAVLGGSSKVAAIILTYPFQVGILISGVKLLIC